MIYVIEIDTAKNLNFQLDNVKIKLDAIERLHADKYNNTSTDGGIEWSEAWIESDIEFLGKAEDGYF